MTEEEQRLSRCWRETFGEPPALIDADLMRPILEAAHEAEDTP